MLVVLSGVRLEHAAAVATRERVLDGNAGRAASAPDSLGADLWRLSVAGSRQLSPPSRQSSSRGGRRGQAERAARVHLASTLFGRTAPGQVMLALEHLCAESSASVAAKRVEALAPEPLELRAPAARTRV